MKIENENRFELLQRDWVQISPYGDFPHQRGLQRVDRAAAETMARNFHSLLGRAGRLFGGAPFYIGHPDMPGSNEHADKKAYGWITRLEARENGLYGFVKWSEPGEQLLRNGHFKFFSPYWEADEIGIENGQRVYRPVLLISVGLTNQPNLPVNPLANEETSQAVEFSCALQGVSVGIERAQETVHAPLTREARAALQNAIASGRLLPCDIARWQERLSNDYATAAPELEKAPAAFHVRSCTEGLRFRREERALRSNRRSYLLEQVRRKMRDGMEYDQAWQALKAERPQLFEAAE